MKEKATDILEFIKIQASYMGEFGIDFDINNVHRFMDACHRGEPVNLYDAQHATVLLEALLHGARNSSEINLGKELRELFDIHRQRSKRFTPAEIAPGSEVYEIIEGYVLAKIKGIPLKERKTGGMTYENTLNEVGKKLFVGEGEAKKIITKISNDMLPYLDKDTEEND